MNTALKLVYSVMPKRITSKSSAKFIVYSRVLTNIAHTQLASTQRPCIFPYKCLANNYFGPYRGPKLRLPLFQCARHFSVGVGGSNEPEKKPSLYQRFKLMYKEYWYVLVPVHIVTSAFWLGGFYYLAVSGVDIAKLLEVIGAPESWVLTMRESKAGGIVTAYTMYKIATPARYTVTLGGTTLSINYLKKWGWIKPMPSKEELKVMYTDKKTALKEKVTATKDEIKDEFVKTRHEITQHMKEARTGFKQSANETREGFKEGIREAADEWRHVGKLVKRNVKEMTREMLKKETKEK